MPEASIARRDPETGAEVSVSVSFPKGQRRAAMASLALAIRDLLVKTKEFQ